IYGVSIVVHHAVKCDVRLVQDSTSKCYVDSICKILDLMFLPIERVFYWRPKWFGELGRVTFQEFLKKLSAGPFCAFIVLGEGVNQNTRQGNDGEPEVARLCDKRFDWLNIPSLKLFFEFL